MYIYIYVHTYIFCGGTPPQHQVSRHMRIPLKIWTPPIPWGKSGLQHFGTSPAFIFVVLENILRIWASSNQCLLPLKLTFFGEIFQPRLIPGRYNGV